MYNILVRLVVLMPGKVNNDKKATKNCDIWNTTRSRATKGFQRDKVRVFPYLIMYRIQKRKKIIAISSIFQTSRNPKKKYSGMK